MTYVHPYINQRNKVVLNEQEKAEVKREFNRFCKDIHVYGNKSQPSKDNDCRRFKRHSNPEKNIFECTIDGKRVPYFAYKVAFMHHNGYFIKTTRRCLGISHICGKQSCINIKHMIIEPNTINNERRTCHNWISDLLTKINNKERINLQQGKITVNIINQAYQQYYPNYNVNNLHYCNHNDHPCFINRIRH